MAKVTCINDPGFLSDFQAGREPAFDALFREFFSPLTYFSCQLTRDRALAEDLVQDCFATLWERRDQFKLVTSIKAYLYTMVKNQSLKARAKLKTGEELHEIPTEDKNIEQHLIAADTAREILLLLSTLPPRIQEVLRLFYLEEKSNAEIARLLDVSVDTVSRQKLRGLTALRKMGINF